MQESVVIEQMKLSEKDKVLAFLKTAYPDNPRQSDPVFWEWHFLEHPFSSPDNIPVWLAKVGERIVGQLAMIPIELDLGPEIVPAIWIIDLIVDPEYRRSGIGKKLALAAQDHYPFTLAIVTDAQHSPAMFLGLGWALVSEIPRFHKILFPGDALREIARIKPLKYLVNLIYFPFRRRIKSFAQSDKLRTITEFDDAAGRLMSEIQGRSGCSVRRSAELLNWQYVRQPNKQFEIIGYYEGEKLMGYVVLFFRKPDSNGSVPKAAISDICYHPDKSVEIVDALLKGALKRSLARRAGGLVTDALDPLLEQRLKHFGFWPIKSGILFMAYGPRKHEVIYDPGKWFITRGDADISIFEKANL